MAAVDLKLDVTPRFAASVFAGTLALCLAASVISCRKVATLDPALVFRGEGPGHGSSCGRLYAQERKGSDP